MEKAVYNSKNGKKYLIKGNHAKLFVETKAFQLWMDRINTKVQMDHLELRDSFVVRDGKVMLFATVLGVNAKINNKLISSYAFLRSDAVAMLPIIEEIEDDNITGNIYTVITEQMRFPYGNILFECPAGMMDDETGISGVAAKEIEEELHEIITKDRLVYLGTSVMSGGGCSERMHYVAFVIQKTKEDLEKIKGKKTGAVLENEDITLHVLPFNTELQLLRALQEKNIDYDDKILAAMTLWRNRVYDLTTGPDPLD